MGPATPESATALGLRGPTGATVPPHYRRTGCRRCHTTPQERQAVEDDHGRGYSPQRGLAGGEIPRPCAVATMERPSPQKPRRDHDATSVKLWGQRLAARDFDRQVAEFQVRGAVLKHRAKKWNPVFGEKRCEIRKVKHPVCFNENAGCFNGLHRAWHPRHEGRRISLSANSDRLPVSRFVQQSPPTVSDSE